MLVPKGRNKDVDKEPASPSFPCVPVIPVLLRHSRENESLSGDAVYVSTPDGCPRSRFHGNDRGHDDAQFVTPAVILAKIGRRAGQLRKKG